MLRDIKARIDNSQQESGAAMIAAILVMVILVSTLIFMTAIGLRGLEKGSEVQAAHASLNAADSAIANALVVANSEANRDGSKLDNHVGVSRAVYGTHHANAINPESGDGLYSWRWYTQKRPDQVSGSVYDIYATGFRDSPDEQSARTIRATIERSIIVSMEYEDDGGITVNETVSGSAAAAATGLNSMILEGTATASEYNSGATSFPTGSGLGRGVVSSNEPVQLNGSGADVLIRGKKYTSVEDSCAGTACTHEDVTIFQRPNYASFAPSQEEGAERCPASASSYPDWIASMQSSTIAYSPTPKCYNNIVFDRDTRLSGLHSTGSPAVMYAKGNVSVNAGVDVANQTNRSQGPYALQIIGISDNKSFTVNRNTAANPTKFTGIFIGNQANCEIGGGTSGNSNHDTTIYGAVACEETTVRSDTKLWWDNQLSNSTRDETDTTKRVWEIVTSQEI